GGPTTRAQAGRTTISPILGEPPHLVTAKKTGLLAKPVDGVHSPPASAGTATHVFPLATPPLYKSPTSLRASGMTPKRSSPRRTLTELICLAMGLELP